MQCRPELPFHTNREHRPPRAPCRQNNCASQRPATSTFTQQRPARLRGSAISCWPCLASRIDFTTPYHDIEIHFTLEAVDQRAATSPRRAVSALHDSALATTSAHVPGNLESPLYLGCDTGVSRVQTGDCRLLRHGGAGQAGGPEGSQHRA